MILTSLAVLESKSRAKVSSLELSRPKRAEPFIEPPTIARKFVVPKEKLIELNP